VKLLAFSIGAAFGAGSRYAMVLYFKNSFRFPIGVLVVNIIGAFLLGVIAEEKSNLGYGLVGFCGALTTWSALSLDLHEQIRNRELRSALINLGLNYGLGIAAAMLGIWVRG
jgi:CrcB protein